MGCGAAVGPTHLPEDLRHLPVAYNRYGSSQCCGAGADFFVGRSREPEPPFYGGSGCTFYASIKEKPCSWAKHDLKAVYKGTVNTVYDPKKDLYQ